jgi:uncharacterized membrane protein
MRAVPTKQSTVLGLPIGRRRTDWARVRRLGVLGLGALSTAVGGLGARLAAGRSKTTDSENAQSGEQTVEEGASSLNGVDKNVKKLRLIIREAIEVGVPVDTAYNQWTQFKEFPAIMRGPRQVDQETDEETHWVAKIGPSRRRWTAKIVEQIPDERIVWESTEGTEIRGAVTFHELDRNLTRVQVEMEYFPHGIVEKIGNIFLAARRRTRKDLRLYKHFLELEGSETGAWRGEIWDEEQEEEDVEQEQEPAPEQAATDDQPETGRRRRRARASAG